MVLKMSLSSLYVCPRTEETMSILLTKNCFLGARAFAMAPRCESAPAVCRHLLNAFSTMKMSVHITNNSNNSFCDLKKIMYASGSLDLDPPVAGQMNSR